MVANGVAIFSTIFFKIRNISQLQAFTGADYAYEV